MMKDSVLWQHNLIDCYQNETLLPTCTNTHETTCSFTSFPSFLSLLFSPPVCVLLLRGGVIYQAPGSGVWAQVFDGVAEGMHCQKVSDCQPAIIRPSFFSFSSLVLYPRVQWSHICQTLPWWAAERGAPSFCLFFFERFGRLYGQLKQTEGMLDIFVFSHPLKLHRVTISRLGCANPNGFDTTQRVTHSGLTSEIMHLYVWWCSLASCLKHSCQVSGNAAVNIAIIFVFLLFFYFFF